MNQVNAKYDWQRWPEASRKIWQRVDAVVSSLPFARELAKRMRMETGTRFIDWVDHLALSRTDTMLAELESIGYRRDESMPLGETWRHDGAMLPAIRVGETEREATGVFLGVESVVEFAIAHQLDAEIIGGAWSPMRLLEVERATGATLGVIERHGVMGFQPADVSSQDITNALFHAEAFRRRRRDFESEEQAFDHATQLVHEAVGDIGVDWACDLFFAAERSFWQSRNHAARVQKHRQDRLGLGWANHDHHTYRSSREYFTHLIALFELLGFQCRERFYGGAEAGWGAQVLSQSHAGIVIFADVDLSPTEVTGDFAHEKLNQAETLGTVGLWCKLHGEAVLQAGMHHLECQFDFDSARLQLLDSGIHTMEPFTDFEYLKQAFTVGENWNVDVRRVEAACEQKWISRQQADHFLKSGSVGSHLEILQREDGYKGFNQTGISEIIRATDPRRLSDP